MCPGQYLDRRSVGGVTGDRAVVVAVGAHQIGQQFGVPGIGLGSRNVVAVAVAGGGHRIDGIHLVASRHQRGDPQAAIGFDADHDLASFLDVAGQELMELTDAGKSLG